MATSDEFDPMAAWQKFVGMWERQFNDWSTSVSSKPEFAGPMNQTAKLTLGMRRSFDETMEKLATSMQLATHAQMAEVIERLDRIEERIDAIASAVAPRDEQRAPAPPPRRTRQPASRSE